MSIEQQRNIAGQQGTKIDRWQLKLLQWLQVKSSTSKFLRLGLVFLASTAAQLLFPRIVEADALVAGTGLERARDLVSGISGVRTAMAETRIQKDEASKAEARSVSTPGLPIPAALASRFEVTAGTDRLISQNDVLKQASIFAEARYRLNDWLQIGGTVGLRMQGTGNAIEMAMQPLFGPTFNLGTGHGLQNAFFISPKIGITVERTTLDGKVIDSGSKFTTSLSAGKRFALSDHVAFVPSVGVLKESGATPGYSIVPIAISIFF